MFIQEEVRVIKNIPSKMRPKQPRAENKEEKKLPRIENNDMSVKDSERISARPDDFVHYKHMNHNCYMP